MACILGELVACILGESLVLRYEVIVASSPGHSQILSCSHREKLGEGLGSKLRHEQEMVDMVCTNWAPFPVRDVVLIPSLLPIFLHGYEIKSGSGLGMRLRWLLVLRYDLHFGWIGGVTQCQPWTTAEEKSLQLNKHIPCTLFFVSELPVVNFVILKIFESSVLLVRYEVKRAPIIQNCVQSDFTPTSPCYILASFPVLHRSYRRLQYE